MTTSDLPTPSYKSMYEAILARHQFAEKFSAVLASICGDSPVAMATFSEARRCVAVGTGTGRYELEFIEKTMPKLETLVVVAPDRDAVSDMRIEAKRRLPGVDVVVYECKLEDWEGIRGPTDVLLLFSVMYYIQPADRVVLYRKLVDGSWLTPDGLVVVVSVGDTDYSRGAWRLARLLNPKFSMPTSETINSEMKWFGFRAISKHEFRCSHDITEVNEMHVRYMEHWLGVPLYLQDIKRAINQVWPGQTTYNILTNIAVYAKKPRTASRL